MLPFVILGSANERSHDRIARIKTSREVSDSYTDFDWWAIAAAGDMHEPKLASYRQSLNQDLASAKNAHASTMTS